MNLRPLSIIALTLLALTLATATNTLTAQDAGRIQKGEMAGYLLVPNERGPETYNAGFSMYVAAWPLLDQYPGQRFQTGLFGTWISEQSGDREGAVQATGRCASCRASGREDARLDRFASQSTWFKQFHVAATVWSPSRCAFMTSHFAVRNRRALECGRLTQALSARSNSRQTRTEMSADKTWTGQVPVPVGMIPQKAIGCQYRMNANKKLFLSAVSGEFEGCRQMLAVVRSELVASSNASSPLL